MPPRWLVIALDVRDLVTIVLTLLVTLVRHQGMTP
jgi:hypothetical protein